jgi:hypothetical protein
MFAKTYEFINMMATLIACFYIFGRVLNCPTAKKHVDLSVLWCLGLTLLYSLDPFGVPLALIWLVFCSASILFILARTKINLNTVVSAFMLSFGISYVLYYVASFIIALASAPIVGSDYVAGTSIDYNRPQILVVYTLISTLHLTLSYLFFRIPRFNKGFTFLHSWYAVIIALVTAGIVMVFVSGVKMVYDTDDVFTLNFLFAGIGIVGVGLYIWIRRSIKAFYKKWVLKNNAELHQQTMDEKDREILLYKEMAETQRAANHRLNHRLAALERSIVGMSTIVREQRFSSELSDELAIAMEDVQRLANEYSAGSAKREKPLPSTNIKMVDDLFAHFAALFSENGIAFNLKVSGSIVHMTEKVIEQGKLETMIGDVRAGSV